MSPLRSARSPTYYCCICVHINPTSSRAYIYPFTSHVPPDVRAIDGPHKIVRLLGVCTDQEPFLMIMELMERGDLKTVLRDARPKARAVMWTYLCIVYTCVACFVAV